MIKLFLANHKIILKIYLETGDQPQTIEINNGLYNNKIYASLILSNDNIMLEGDEIAVLAIKAKAVIIQVENIMMKLATLTGDNSIYTNGINAITEGTERELMTALIQPPL